MENCHRRETQALQESAMVGINADVHALRRMVKTLMRLRVRSIAAAPEPFTTLHRAFTL
jgi:hypothetical protein